MMDPEDTQSEYPGQSVASSTVFDTQSEPPGFSYMEADKKQKKRRDSSGRSVKSSASYCVARSTASSSGASASVFESDSRSITSSASNASKLDARLTSSTRSQNATSRASSKASKSRATSASSSSKNKDSSVLSSAASSSREVKSSKSKNSTSKSSSSSSSKLALVPKAKVSADPPTASDSQSTAYSSRSYSNGSLEPPSFVNQGVITNYDEVSPPLASEDSNNRLTTIDSISGASEYEYEEYEDEEYDDDDDDDSYTRASELASAVERALVIRRATLEEQERELGQHELIEYDDSIPKTDEGEIIPAGEKYLATAVDNMHSMVPIDSNIYEAYDHTFVTCPEFARFRFLYTFLRKNLDKKILIFFSTSNSVRFHAELLNRFRIPVLQMHSRQRREKFINTFFKFSDMEEGILCTTDAAGRDLDVPPSVDYVMQFEPPDDPAEYILRIARVSCDSDRIGRSILFLNPGEQGFLKYYTSAAITVSEFELPRLADNQLQIESIVNESERLLQYAKDGYGSYLISYASHGFRDVYNVHDLNKADVAAAFGLVNIPGDDIEAEDESTYFTGSSRDHAHSTKGRKTTWETTKKPASKTWMKGEKSWPHCQIKIHPRFKQSRQVPDDYPIYEEESEETPMP